MFNVMFLSLITKITGDYQAANLLGSGLGMFVYILLGSGLGMLVIPLTWIWAWYARHPSYLDLGLVCSSSLLLGSGLGLFVYILLGSGLGLFVIARSRQVVLA